METQDRTYNLKNDKKLAKEQKRALWLNNKDKLLLSQIIKPIVFFILAISIEMLNFYMLDIRSASGSRQLFPTYIFFDIGLWLIIAGLILISTKVWLSNLLFYFFIIFQVVICIVNSTLHADFGYLFTWDLIALAFEALDSFSFDFLDLKTMAIYGLILVVFIAIPLIIDYFGKKKLFKIKKITRPILMLVLFFSFFLMGGTCYSVQALTLSTGKNHEYKEIESDKYLYSNMHITDEAYRKFGTCGFYTKNLYDLTIGGLFVKNKSETIEAIKNQEVAENPSASLYNQNLIVIMLESFEWFAIDPYNTPNLWKLKTGSSSLPESTYIPSKGVTVTNYISNNKTNVSEDAVLLGYIPQTNQLKFKNNNTYSTLYSLPNMFKKQGYTTNFFHNFEPTFYERNTVNKNLGFDKFYNNDDFVSAGGQKAQFDNYALEADFIDTFINQIAPTDKKFMSFYTTVSTHGNYDVSKPKFNKYYQTYDNNLSKFRTWLLNEGYTYPTDSKVQNQLREYKSACIDSDVMVGRLFEHLSENNMLENTNIIIYSDHNAYYHNLTNVIKSTDVTDTGNLKTHNVPLMIYSQNLGSKTINNFCNTFDLYPTICELFGLNYSKFFTQGYNILSNEIENSLYVSHLTGFYNSMCYSKSMKNIYLYENGTDDDISTFKINVCKYYKKQILIERVYKSQWKIS